VTKKILNLVVGTLAFGAIVAFISRLLWPELPVPLFCMVASGLCLIPAVVTLIWANRPSERLPENQLLIVVGGTAVRMMLVLGVGLILYYRIPVFERMSFWITILIFYLFTLAFEMVLLLSGPLKQPGGKQI
jgi:hypothetical protein